MRTPNLLEKLKSTSSAPEVLLRNELTAKSDVWSIGIVLIEVSIIKHAMKGKKCSKFDYLLMGSDGSWEPLDTRERRVDESRISH